jgi:hypothetical protein
MIEAEGGGQVKTTENKKILTLFKANIIKKTNSGQATPKKHGTYNDHQQSTVST